MPSIQTKKPVTKKATPVKKVTKPKATTGKAVDLPQHVGKSTGLSVSVYGVDGKVSGKILLPRELFGAKVNNALLAQSVRVYLANQREGGARAKTRGEVEGSTRKIYRQKGTGKARHGSIRAPIFVGGGVVFGPVTRDYHLKLNKSMKRAALFSALSARVSDTSVIDGLEAIEPKTKNVAAMLSAMGKTEKVLLVVGEYSEKLIRSARNIRYLDIINAKNLHPYALLVHKQIIFTKKSLEESTAHFGNKS